MPGPRAECIRACAFVRVYVQRKGRAALYTPAEAKGGLLLSFRAWFAANVSLKEQSATPLSESYLMLSGNSCVC